MAEICIKNIYSGKPDAKDEIEFEGIEGFVNSYFIPDSFDIDSLLYGSNCFITGYKGTGKTALLYYLEYLIKSEAPHACTSFVFFKDEFTETKKQQYTGFSQRIISSITFGADPLLDTTDFEYIWRWLFFKRIVSDNEDYSENLFENDENWQKFKSIVDKIQAPTDRKKNVILSKIKLAVPLKDPMSQTAVAPELEVDFSNTQNSYSYTKFISLLDEAEKQIPNLRRTETPYYIFVDELEAYYGDADIFKRDLWFIRDLLFSVKRLNGILCKLNNKTKIVCSARVEIINAIQRFIVTKEVNKIVNGFEVPIIWNYSNTTSYLHPIIQVLLKRIALSEGNEDPDYKEIYGKWFPEKIHNIEPANYILNNSWNKPRDIVRLISSAQSTFKSNEKMFNQSVFDAIRKQYSVNSLSEIKEELRALYTSDEIDLIVTCFTGFKATFSTIELKKHIHSNFADTFLETRYNNMIADLYRLGFLGNYHPASGTYRWQHKGDEGVIPSGEWRLMIHYALQSALAVGGQLDYALMKNKELDIGDSVSATITKIIPSFAFVDIEFYGKTYKGSIYIGNISNEYIKDINDVVSVGDTYHAKIIGFNEKHELWDVSLIIDPETDN